ncbi:hypothetical protein [Micromonospora deserti]|uniref:Uncharacterized protein n=1 Tax=Micromonospora deserti TaxID=2070366 RepID=A0A2W2CFL6_9ACTN|nr:hypothetical protein [Micromonospora deserti]PZF91744.1 hypothetical protein C1I99_22855 [Micromonospora deserti]
MPYGASTHPLWSVTLRSLRRLTRLAVTALALAIGLNGATTAPTPPTSATAVQAAAVSSRFDALRPGHPADAERPADAAAARPARPQPDPGPATVPTAGRLDPPGGESGSGPTTRRGPPTA